MKLLSVIIPVYNEEKMIPQTVGVISDILKNTQIDYELLFVNDGSKDMSWPAIAEECEKNEKVKGILYDSYYDRIAVGKYYDDQYGNYWLLYFKNV